jgi:hypothetical protein
MADNAFAAVVHLFSLAPKKGEPFTSKHSTSPSNCAQSFRIPLISSN